MGRGCPKKRVNNGARMPQALISLMFFGARMPHGFPQVTAIVVTGAQKRHHDTRDIAQDFPRHLCHGV